MSFDRTRLLGRAVTLLLVVGAVSACRAAPPAPAAELIHTPNYPQRVVLTWDGDPATTQAVNWHTGADSAPAVAQIAPAVASPKFSEHAVAHPARTQTVADEEDAGYFHSVRFTDLEPDTLYAYRVGNGEVWSAWYQFRTAAREAKPFNFIYLGDAQNNILSHWSRTVRGAFKDMPDARFILHAGDLVNRANSSREWAEWFESAGWIHGMVPAIATPGNHEYFRTPEQEGRQLSYFWRPHFTFPENGPAGFEETVYYVDFQGVRIISLNSVIDPEAQVEWLERVLQDNPHRWTFVTCHYPMYTTKPDRNNDALRETWMPLFEKHGVDMVLQGHDHAYGRGHNLPIGRQRTQDETGTVYVVSVSGPKMYDADFDSHHFDRVAENTQLYQLISIDGDTLKYRAKTVTGEVYDAFDLIKADDGRANRLIERLDPDTPVRRFENTVK